MSETIIGTAPQGWTYTTLAQLCIQGEGGIQTGPFGSQLHASDYVTSGIPSVMPKNIGENVILEESIARISTKDAQRLSKYLLAEGDIVYSRRGDVERRALVRAEQEGWLCGTGCLRVRPGNSVNPRFLSYYLGHPEVRRWVVQHAVGATMPNLNTGILGAVPIVVPPTLTQEAIAETLGALDDKIAVNERTAILLDEITHTIHESMFAGPSETSLLKGWKEGRLSDLCTTQYGYTASSALDKVGPHFLRVKDINKKNWIEWNSVPYCEIPQDKIAKYRLEKGDILVARMADPGKSAIVENDVDAVFASYLVRLKTESLAHSYFAWGFLKSRQYSQYAQAARSGSVQSNMNAKIITAAELAIPPRDLMESYTQRILPLRRKLSSTLAESRTLAELRDTLLPQLMSGKLRVKDAEKIVEDNT